MNYGKINTADVANGPGVRVSLFVSGCRNHCKGCFNKETWDFGFGEEFTEEVRNSLLSELEKPYITGLSILGGEPLEPENAKELSRFLMEVKIKFNRSRPIWLYTGYKFEDLDRSNDDIGMILGCVDYIVDGKFVEKEKDLSITFRGSRNQRILKNRHAMVGIVYDDVTSAYDNHDFK